LFSRISSFSIVFKQFSFSSESIISIRRTQLKTPNKRIHFSKFHF
jgi:hypothetical protein